MRETGDKPLVVRCWGRLSLLAMVMALPAHAAGPWRAADLDGFLCLQAEDGSLTCPGAAKPAPAGPFAQFSVGTHHACGVRTDGTLACWGSPNDVIPPSGRFTKVDVSGRDACAISVEGEIRCWNLPAGPLPITYSRHGTPERAVPPQPPPGRFRLVRVVDGAGCALRVDGELACWGHPGLAATPRGPFTDVSLSHGACALRQEGLIHCWEGRVTAPPGVFVALAGNCGLRADGSLVCPPEAYLILPFLEGLRFRQVGPLIAMSAFAGVLRDGRFVLSGDVPPALLGPVVAVSLRGDGGHWCAARADGGIACNTGLGSMASISYGPEPFVGVQGECGVTAAGRVLCPVSQGVADWRPECRAHPGWRQGPEGELCCGIDGGGAIVCQSERVTCPPAPEMQREPGETARTCVPPPPPDLDFKRVVSGRGHACGLHADGRLDCWGSCQTWRQNVSWADVSMAAPPGRYRDVVSGSSHICALRLDDTVACWGEPPEARQVPNGRFRLLAARGSMTCGVRFDGALVCWGSEL